MPLTAGLAIGGLGAAGSVVGGKEQANAQQNIAQSQQAMAGQTQQQALGYAQPTSYDIQALQQQLGNYQQTYTQQAAQLAQEQSLQGITNAQTTSMLNGGSAPTLNPYLNIVAQQKQSLMADMSRQLGPGWENTTAGQQALQNFNLQSANQGAQIQQQYLGTSMAASMGLGSLITGGINQGAQTLSSINQGMAGMQQNQQGLQIGALEGTNLTPYQGSQYIGQLGQGAQMGNMGNQMLGAGTTLGMMGMYSGMQPSSYMGGGSMYPGTFNNVGTGAYPASNSGYSVMGGTPTS